MVLAAASPRASGQGWRVVAFSGASALGLRTLSLRHQPGGGVCNSLESCTELRSAQPQGSGVRRRRSAARRGRGEVGEASSRPAP